MNDALLYLCLWKYSFDCLWKSCQSIHTCDQNIFNATIFQPIDDRKPKFSTFIITHIHSKDFFFTIHVDPKSDINSTFYNSAFTSHMIVDCIHINNCIDFFQRSFLPFFYDRKDLICNPADRTVWYINVVEFFHVRFNISGRHAFCIHGENLFLHVLGNSILIFFD